MRYILDVTQLAKWQGKLTGIPRVMYELSMRYVAQKEQVVCVAWEGDGFYEIDFQTVVAARTAQAPEPEKQAHASLVKKVIKKLYHVAPTSMQQVAQKVKHRLKSTQTAEKEPAFAFQANDRLVVLWGDMNSPEYIQYVADVVHAQKVQLFQFIHDMLPLVTPQFSAHTTEGMWQYVRTLLPLARKILVISENTKRDVIAWSKEHGSKVPEVKVIRLGDDFHFAKAQKPEHSFFRELSDYAICVGTFEIRKNHILLYYTYKLAAARGIALPPLVIVGRRGWCTEQAYELMTKDPEVKDSFIFLHNATDEELSWLYEHSLFSVYPSLYEGWGLPIAESIAHGVPCACSNSSSMPEVAGELAQYFNPTSTDECLAALQDMTKKSHRTKVRKNLSQYKITKWDETFEQVDNIIGGEHV